MESANQPSEKKINDLNNLFSKMESILKSKGKIYIHCSAGIHRTGMITYAFLRFIGNDLENAIETLGKLRLTTKDGMGQKRIEWGNSIYEILDKKNKTK